jgi:polyisoprenoid-binding protein YceI
MRRFPIIAYCFALMFIGFIACKNDGKSPEPSVPAATPPPAEAQATILPDEANGEYPLLGGQLTWLGKKTVGDAHTGTIALKSGTLTVEGGKLLRGEVVLDMGSIAVTDIRDAGERRDLESHLRDADFFEVGKFPEARFRFTEVLPSNLPEFNHVLSGELTMKGKTNPVNVPVLLRYEGGKIAAQSPAFTINRTKWGVNFRSGMLGTVKDKMIEDLVSLSLKVEAKRR